MAQLRCTLKLTPSHGCFMPYMSTNCAAHQYTNASWALGGFVRSCLPDTVVMLNDGLVMEDVGPTWTEGMFPLACFDEPIDAVSQLQTHALLPDCPSRSEQSCRIKLCLLHTPFGPLRVLSERGKYHFAHPSVIVIKGDRRCVDSNSSVKEVGLGPGKKRIYPAGTKVGSTPIGELERACLEKKPARFSAESERIWCCCC